MVVFINFLDDDNLINLVYLGDALTWRKRKLIVRLDKYIINLKWRL